MTFGPWDVVCGDAWQWRAHTAIHSTGVVHCGHSIGHNVFVVNYDTSFKFGFSKCEAPKPLIFLAFLNNAKLESEIRFRCQTTRRLDVRSDEHPCPNLESRYLGICHGTGFIDRTIC